MMHVHAIVTVLVATLFIFSGTCAHAQMSEEAKIEALIAAIQKTPEGTTFIRNGTEYGSEKAAEHLRAKYERGKKYAGTAALFIENIASKSSFSGREYGIKFADGTTMTAREFFKAELKKLEKINEALTPAR